VIRRALAEAGVQPSEVGYIEAHGTGTPLGDPIEVGALGKVFAERSDPLYVGSVKTNIGHLEFAAGVAGLMKLVMALQQGSFRPTCTCSSPTHTSTGRRCRCVSPPQQPLGPQRSAADWRGQFLRLQRHQRACRGRGSARSRGCHQSC
jgi:3-oxoacyl-(acyl-carrier-protein) synthase